MPQTKMNLRVLKLWHLISINTSQCESRCDMQSSLSFCFCHLCRSRSQSAAASASSNCCCDCCKCCRVAALPAVAKLTAATATWRCLLPWAAFILLWNGFCHLFIAFSHTNEIWLKCVSCLCLGISCWLWVHVSGRFLNVHRETSQRGCLIWLRKQATSIWPIILTLSLGHWLEDTKPQLDHTAIASIDGRLYSTLIARTMSDKLWAAKAQMATEKLAYLRLTIKSRP